MSKVLERCTFSAAMKVVLWMIQLFHRKKGAIFRVIQIESDWTEIMAQSGAERLVELRFLVRNPIGA